MAKMRSSVVIKVLNRLWRQLATGFSFLIFGVGGLVLTLIVMPASLLIVDGPAGNAW